MLVDIPKENTRDTPSKSRSLVKPFDVFASILGYRSGTGSLNITNADVTRLKPGEFLNDTLIELGLK
jgi:Ulp1 family protease